MLGKRFASLLSAIIVMIITVFILSLVFRVEIINLNDLGSLIKLFFFIFIVTFLMKIFTERR